MSENGIRRIFYDVLTGERLQEIGRTGAYFLPTIEQDIETYKSLSERNRETFDYIELSFDDYAQDFRECNGYRINTTTKKLEFSYPDPNEPQAEPVYVKPLTEQNAELQQVITQMSADFQALTDLLAQQGVI